MNECFRTLQTNAWKPIAVKNIPWKVRPRTLRNTWPKRSEAPRFTHSAVGCRIHSSEWIKHSAFDRPTGAGDLWFELGIFQEFFYGLLDIFWKHYFIALLCHTQANPFLLKLMTPPPPPCPRNWKLTGSHTEHFSFNRCIRLYTRLGISW